MREVARFEERYLQRAADAVAARVSPQSIAEIRLDRGKGADEPSLGGWWCPPDSPKPLLLLPNPWDDRPAIDVHDRHSWHLAGAVLDRLSPLMDGAAGRRGRAYWDALLLPWLLQLVTVVLDRRLFLLAATELAPRASVRGGQLAPPPTTMLEGAVALQGERHNASLMTLMAQQMGIGIIDAPPAEPTAPTLGHRGGSRLARALRDPAAVRAALAERWMRRRLGGRDGRTITMLPIPPTPAFSPAELDQLAERVPGLRVSPGTDAAALDPSAARGEHPLRRRLHETATGDPWGNLVAGLLHAVLPRSVLEGHAQLADASLRRHGDATHVVVGNYFVDELENDFIGRCRTAGYSVAFVQHGGSYGALRVHAMGRPEHRSGSTFVSWGPDGNGTPAPMPGLARLRDSHRGGDRLMLIEYLEPPRPYLVQFSTTPLGNQGYDVPRMLADFAENVRLPRNRLALKAFPTFVEAPSRPPALEALDKCGQSKSWLAPDWMRRARLVAIPYPDTPLIEAMLIGVPTIAFWNPELWEMRDDAAPFFEELERAGVLYTDPAAAATKASEVYESAGEWWAGAQIQAARGRFLDRFAMGGNWLERWTQLIADMQGQTVV
jgi:hypothetical protein